MKKTIENMDIRSKRVLMRADFNVPLNDEGEITDDNRITAALPTIEHIISGGGRLILMSHLGRPKGKVESSLKMDPVAERLSELVGKKVLKLDDCIGPDVEKAVGEMSDGDVVLLENLRFHPEEKENEPEFVKALARLGEVFVEDAFGTCHRAHASTAGVPQEIPSAAGFLLRKELEYFEKVTTSPDQPFCLLLGGAKVADKIPVIENMLAKIDYLLIGGAMAYTFLKTRLKGVGASRLEEDMVDTVNKIFEKAGAEDVSIFLPSDHVVAREIDAKAKRQVVKEHIPDGWIGLDIGPATIKEYKKVLKESKTIVWNGPMGLFEMEPFAKGTKALAKYIAKLKGATTVIGGGDTAAAVNQMGLGDKMSHISTGGGASLAYLQGKQLPGVAALDDE